MKKMIVAVLLIVAFITMICVFEARAASDITFAWDASTEAITGYRLYQSTVSGSYNKTTGKVCEVLIPGVTCIVKNIQDGTYYWVATAYKSNGLESAFSNEVKLVLDTVAPNPPKGLKNVNILITVNLTTGRAILAQVQTLGTSN